MVAKIAARVGISLLKRKLPDRDLNYLQGRIIVVGCVGNGLLTVRRRGESSVPSRKGPERVAASEGG